MMMKCDDAMKNFHISYSNVAARVFALACSSIEISFGIDFSGFAPQCGENDSNYYFSLLSSCISCLILEKL